MQVTGIKGLLMDDIEVHVDLAIDPLYIDGESLEIPVGICKMEIEDVYMEMDIICLLQGEMSDVLRIM